MAEEIVSLLSTYYTIRELKRNVINRIRELEQSKSKKAKHGISGLKSTLKTLEDKALSIIRTIEARISTQIGAIEECELLIKPASLTQSANKENVYYVTILDESELNRIRQELGEEPQSIGLEQEHPVICIEIRKLPYEDQDIEKVISCLLSIAKKFESIPLPIKVMIRKHKIKDVELLKSILKLCIINPDKSLVVYFPKVQEQEYIEKQS